MRVSPDLNRMEKYPGPMRLPIGPRISRKPRMTPEQASFLLAGRVVVEEKMDGKTLRFPTPSHVFFAEDLKTRHSISYKVPARYVLFDVFDVQAGYFLDYRGLLDIYNDQRLLPKAFPQLAGIGFFPVPLLEVGKFSLAELPKIIRASCYGNPAGTPMEGIVVKQDRLLYPEEFVNGKLVRKEFSEGIELHYSRDIKVFNIISPDIPLAPTPPLLSPPDWARMRAALEGRGRFSEACRN